MDEPKLYGKADEGLDSLIQTVRFFTSDICIDFRIEKCTILILKRVIKDKICDMGTLQDNLKISSLKESENYKYLGIF